MMGLSACGELPRGPAVPRAEAMRATVLGIPNERFHPLIDVKLAQDELLQAAERGRRTYGVATPFDMPQYNMCRAGSRSAHATAILQKVGFSDIANLPGGMLRWRAEGRAVEGGAV